jgi:hypothetical protein
MAADTCTLHLTLTSNRTRLNVVKTFAPDTKSIPFDIEDWNEGYTDLFERLYTAQLPAATVSDITPLPLRRFQGTLTLRGDSSWQSAIAAFCALFSHLTDRSPQL